MFVQSRKHRGGFTLVELLVVIGIIAVLIGVLLPALSKARNSATILKCAANERSLGQAFQQYASQFKGLLPSFLYYNGENQTWKSWDYLLQETVMKYKNRDDITNNGTVSQTNAVAWQVFACPADDLPRKAGLNYQTMPIRSYALNQSQYGYGLVDSASGVHDGSFKMPWSGGCKTPGTTSFDQTLVKSEKLSKVPPHVWLLGENWGTTSKYSMSATPSIDPTQNGAVVGTYECSMLQGSPARFHARAMFGNQWTGTGQNNGVAVNSKAFANEATGGNYLYADGHVEFVRFADVVTVRADTDPGSNKTLLNDHWKWRTSR